MCKGAKVAAIQSDWRNIVPLQSVETITIAADHRGVGGVVHRLEHADSRLGIAAGFDLVTIAGARRQQQTDEQQLYCIKNLKGLELQRYFPVVMLRLMKKK